MGVEFLNIPIVAILAIIIMISSLVIAFLKKWMITYALIIANFLVFVLTILFESDIIGIISINQVTGELIIDPAGLGFRPIYLTYEYSPQLYTLFTSMFVHGSIPHIFGNMFIFLFLGLAFEQRVGSKNFLAIYLISGVCGTVAHSMMNLNFPDNYITLIGASGAIFGIMGAFAFSYPRDEVVLPIPMGIMLIMRIKVIYAVIIFAAMETIIVMVDVQDSTAHFAHLGGLIGGFILAAVLLGKQKKHTKSGETIYYDQQRMQQKQDIDFTKLEKLAKTPEQKEIIDKIRNETVPQVQNIWLGHFLEKVKCPKCDGSLKHKDGDIWCENCDYKDNY